MTAAAPKALRRRPFAAAARPALIALAAAGLAVLALVAAPAHADLAAAKLVAPLGEETRGNDHGRDWQHAVQVVANLRAKRPKVPLVVLLGGSAARECTVHDDDWTDQIKRRSGFEVLTYNLASKHRTYAQDLAFVKLLPRVPTIVYIGVNLGRFCIAPRRASVHLPRARPLRYYPQHVYTRRHIQSASEKRYYVSYWMQRRWPEFQAHYRGELAMLQKIIRVCKRRHLRVALLDLPRDLPVIGSAFNAPVSRYRSGCASLARRWDIPWLHFVARARFVDRDFFDIFHLVEPGREKYQSILSDKTIRLLRKYQMPKPTPTPTPTPSQSGSPTPSPSASPSASPTAVASH